MSWSRAFELLENYLDLPPELVREIMRDILEGRADNENLKRFLLALKEKGETSDEVGAMVSEMYEHSAPISITERAVDIVGTGGDGTGTYNISTGAAILPMSNSSRAPLRFTTTRPSRTISSIVLKR